jgi:hypothetical protein
MNETNRVFSPEELSQLQKKFTELKRDQQRPCRDDGAVGNVAAPARLRRETGDHGFNKPPQVVSNLQELTQLLNAKAGVKPATAGEAN